MKSIRLTIAEPWFSMIKNGIKKEEYRDNCLPPENAKTALEMFMDKFIRKCE